MGIPGNLHFLTPCSVFCTSVAPCLSLRQSAELWKYSYPPGPSNKLRVSTEKIQVNNLFLNKMSMWGTWCKIRRSTNWQSQHWWIWWFWDINVLVCRFQSTCVKDSRGTSLKGNKYGFWSSTDLCLETISFTTRFHVWICSSQFGFNLCTCKMNEWGMMLNLQKDWVNPTAKSYPASTGRAQLGLLFLPFLPATHLRA